MHDRLCQHLFFVLIIFLLPFFSCGLPARVLPDCKTHFTARSFFDRANQLRASAELEALKEDPVLSEQAFLIADYNAGNKIVSHFDEEGRGPLERLKRAGLTRRTVAENIAVAPVMLTVERIIESWKGKKEEENLMNPLYQRAGFATTGNPTGCMFVVIMTE